MSQGNIAIVEPSQIRTGLYWSYERFNRERERFELWNNQHDKLLMAGRGVSQTSFNLADPSTLVRVNFFRAVTEFYVSGLWSQAPSLQAETRELQVWLDDREAMLFEALEHATRYKSMKGLGVVAAQGDGTAFFVDTSHYMPIVDITDASKVTGHILAYPWNSDPSNRESGPDRLDMVVLHDGVARRSRWYYDGLTLGGMITSMEAMVTGVHTFGRPILPYNHGVSGYVSDYDDIIDIVAAIEKRVTKLDDTLDKNQSPHLQGPVGALQADGTFQRDPEGAYLPRTMEDPEYAYLVYESKEEATMGLLEWLINMISVSTGVSPAAFGIGRNTVFGESGQARERQMQAALNYINRVRRDIENVLRGLVEDMGAPAGSFMVDWVEDPFLSFEERVASEEKLLSAGVLTPEQSARRLLGIRHARGSGAVQETV